MAIKNSDLLAQRLKGVKIDGEEITLEKLTELISDEKEYAIEATEGSFLTDDQINDLKKNVSSGGMRDGVISGAEQAIKAIKKVTGLDYEGKVVTGSDGLVDFEATAKTLVTNFKSKVESEVGKPKEQKVKELEESLQRLRGEYEQVQNEKESALNEFKSKYEGLKKDTFIASNLPKIENYKPQHVIAAFKADGYDLDLSNGEPVVMRNGNVLKDKLEKPVPFNDVITSWAKENNFIAHQGRGGATETGGEGSTKFKDMTEAYRFMRENNINPASEEADKIKAQVEAA